VGVALEWRIFPAGEGKSASRYDDVLIAELAARQHGVVARGQLLALAIGRNAIDHRLARGRLHPIHRGVFAVGHPVRSSGATWMAAVLAGGPGAVLGHRSAAAIWGIRSSSAGAVDIICPRRLERPGIRGHRVVLREDEVTVHDGIPVTTPARTLFDLAAVVPRHQLEAAFNEAEVRRLASPTSLPALLARYPGRRGNTAIQALLDNHVRNGESRTRNELEHRLLALLDAHDLPRPQTNRLSAHGELDAAWPDRRLVVELDGFATHGTRRAFEADRARDRRLVADGWRVLRVTWRQLSEDGDTIAAQIRSLVAAPQPDASSRPAHRSTARSWAA
jgi:very-short-patch-repair endonuclease